MCWVGSESSVCHLSVMQDNSVQVPLAVINGRGNVQADSPSLCLCQNDPSDLQLTVGLQYTSFTKLCAGFRTWAHSRLCLLTPLWDLCPVFRELWIFHSQNGLVLRNQAMSCSFSSSMAVSWTPALTGWRGSAHCLISCHASGSSGNACCHLSQAELSRNTPPHQLTLVLWCGRRWKQCHFLYRAHPSPRHLFRSSLQAGFKSVKTANFFPPTLNLLALAQMVA